MINNPGHNQLCYLTDSVIMTDHPGYHAEFFVRTHSDHKSVLIRVRPDDSMNESNVTAIIESLHQLYKNHDYDTSVYVDEQGIVVRVYEKRC